MAHYLWPIIISLAVLAVAYFIFYVLEGLLDFDINFLWVPVFFILLYAVAAGFVLWKLPSPFTANAAESTQETIIPDVIVK